MSESADADALLVDRAKRGEVRAFEMLVVKYQRRIERLVGRMVRDADLVQDIAQESFIRAYRALPQFRGEVPAHYFFGSSKRSCVDSVNVSPSISYSCSANAAAKPLVAMGPTKPLPELVGLSFDFGSDFACSHTAFRKSRDPARSPRQSKDPRSRSPCN